ncbi:MAG TPA: adenylosuccinate synthase [Polyangia bacterium]
MSVVVIVGAQWGDEGKGKVVDLLTERAHVVARWGGGANAGHTLVVAGKKYVTHLIPSGVLRPGVTCVLGEGMVIDPRTLLEEIHTFQAAGLLKTANELVIAGRAHVVLPHHRELDSCREARPNAIGSTRRGIGPTYESKASRTGVRVEDLIDPARFRKALERNLASIMPLLKDFGSPKPDVEAIVAEYAAVGAAIKPFVRDASRYLHEQIRAGKNVLFEGAQGVLLDLDHGTYPFVTSSSTTAGGACAALGIGPTLINEVVGICKAYATRVGNGPFPTELLDETGERLRQVGAEFGSTTGRPRRCGWLDLPALRLAARLSGIEHVALTKLDVLAGLPTVKLCVAYRLRGELVDELPVDAEELAAAEPVYEELPGWAPVAGVQSVGSLKDLPENAQRYVARISELSGLPFSLVSVGPGREETIVTKDLFPTSRRV